MRALAIAPVVLFHAGVPGFGGGFIGVDVFFVISGFLITTLIIEQLDAGTFSIWHFYERRARRILPALLVMLAASSAFAWLLFVPDDFRNFAQGLAATAAFASNFLFAAKVDYFSSGEGFRPLLHGWSLSVEEQFYLVFPAIVLGVARYRRRALPAVVGVLLAASLALAVVVLPSHPTLAFYMLPTRLWELLAGAFCALLPAPSLMRQWAGLAGLALLGAGFVLIDAATPAPGAMFVLPVAGTLLVLRYAAAPTWAGRLLGLRPLVGLGLISYGTYLWHQPVLAFLHYVWLGELPALLVAGAVALSVGLGAVSYRYVEQPLRQRRMLPDARSLALAAGAALAIALLTGLAGHWRLIAPRSAAEAARLGAHDSLDRHVTTAVPETGPLPFLLFGDSHARQYFRAMEERFGPGGLLTMSGCLALPGFSNWQGPGAEAAECRAMPNRLLSLARTGRVRTLVWAQRWDRDLYSNADGRSTGQTSAAAGPTMLAAMERLIQALPPDVHVVIIGNSPTAWAAGPMLDLGYLRCRAYFNTACPRHYPASMAEGTKVNRLLRRFAAGHARVTYVDAALPLCPGGQCPIVTAEGLYYWDGSHMTLTAARKVVGTINGAAIGQGSSGPIPQYSARAPL